MAFRVSNLIILSDGGDDNILVSFPNEIFTNTTVLHLKEQISVETGCEIESQTLLYNNTVIESIHTFGFYGITRDSYILLSRDSVVLFVSICGSDKMLTFIFPEMEFASLTISELKFEIQNRENIPENKQRLWCNGILLENGTMEEFGIGTNSNITLVTDCVQCIFVKTFTGKTITIIITNKQFSQTTISDLKAKIERNEFIPTNKQRLIFSGRELRNGNTLGYYDIKPKYLLHLLELNSISMCLFVHTSNGKEFQIEFPIQTFQLSTVKDLISKIEQEKGIPLNSQSLYFSGKMLENNTFLSHYNIVNKSVVELKINTRHSNDSTPLEFSEIPFEEKFNQINVSHCSPHLRLVGEGINFRGRCSNSDCEANNKIVYVQKGFYESTDGVCVLHDEIGHLECPICNHMLDKKSIHGVGIYKCRLEVKTKREGKYELNYATESKDSFKFAPCGTNGTIGECVIVVKPI